MHKRNVSEKLKLSNDKITNNKPIVESQTEKKIGKNKNNHDYAMPDYTVQKPPRPESSATGASNVNKKIKLKMKESEKDANFSNTAKIINNLKEKYFKHTRDNFNEEYETMQTMKENIERKYKADLDLKNQLIIHLEGKIKKLESEILDYINRISSEGIKHHNKYEESKYLEDSFRAREKELRDKIHFLEEEIINLKSETKTFSKDNRFVLREDYETIKFKFDELSLISQKKDNLLDIFLFFLE